MKELTERQQEVLNFIKSFLKKRNYPPTIREIADNFGISTKGAYDHVKALEKKAVIQCDAKRSRAIELLGDYNSDNAVFVPLIGKVAAGQPIFAEENLEGYLALSPFMLKHGKRCFALKVSGDSMMNAGILNGDFAVFCEQETAENGEIVLAMMQDEFTLKRYFNEGSRIRLQPENSGMSPIYTRDAKVMGKLIGIMRSYG